MPLFVNIKTSYLTQLYTLKSFFTHITDGSLSPTDSNNSYISRHFHIRHPQSTTLSHIPPYALWKGHSHTFPKHTQSPQNLLYKLLTFTPLITPMSTLYSNQATKLVWRNLRSSLCGQTVNYNQTAEKRACQQAQDSYEDKSVASKLV